MQTLCPKSQIIIAWPNIRKMLYHRGYDVDFIPESVEWSYVSKTLPKTDNTIVLSKRRDDNSTHLNNNKIVINFRIEQKIGIKSARILIEWMKKNHLKRAIIFSPLGATACTSKAMETYQPEITIDIRLYKCFFFCLIEHELVPKHNILNQEEKERVLRALHTEEKFFPQQLDTDPISQYYGLEKGQMICYWVKTGSQEIAPYYRVVV